VYPAAGALIMAIEAARQLTDSISQVVGYRFKDVAIYKALVVPPSAGIEVQFYVRTTTSAREKSGAFLAWNDFRLCVYENREWSDICHGAIALEYATDQMEAGLDEDTIRTLDQIRQDYDDKAKTCNIVVTSEQLYLTLASIGLNYGPSFQSVRDIHHNNNGGATALVNLREWTSKTLDNEIQPHVLHPAALDAIFQVSFAGISQGRKEKIPTMVPTKIPKLWVSAFEDGVDIFNPAAGPPNTTVKVHVESKFLGFRNAKASITALNASTGRPCIVGELETTSLGGLATSASVESGQRQLCYNIDWKPDLALLDKEQMTSYCSTATSVPSPISEGVIEENRLACYLALLKANNKALKSKISPQKPHLLKYVNWMDEQLSTHAASDLPDCWAISKDLEDDEGFLEDLYGKIEKSSTEGEVIARVARKLRSILEGDVDALDLLFNDKLLDEYYRFTHNATSAFQKVALYVDAYAHKDPALKVLEIGAGTGGATTDILHALTHYEYEGPDVPRFSEYAFTDISSSFFEGAKEKFSAHIDRMIFSILNIEQDPLQQNFEAERYDLIIASNVSRALSRTTFLADHRALRCYMPQKI
jgi:Polyketide synthase dehydratase/Methyltransferase domain